MLFSLNFIYQAVWYGRTSQRAHALPGNQDQSSVAWLQDKEALPENEVQPDNHLLKVQRILGESWECVCVFSVTAGFMIAQSMLYCSLMCLVSCCCCCVSPEIWEACSEQSEQWRCWSISLVLNWEWVTVASEETLCYGVRQNPSISTGFTIWWESQQAPPPLVRLLLWAPRRDRTGLLA